MGGAPGRGDDGAGVRLSGWREVGLELSAMDGHALLMYMPHHAIHEKHPPRAAARGRDDALMPPRRPRGVSARQPSPSRPPAGGVRIHRVFEVPAKAVFAAVNDPSRRSWVPEPGLRVVSALAPRFVRFDLPSGGQVSLAIERQGNTRCAVALEFFGVADVDQIARHWRDGLAALAEMLDHDWD